MSLNLARIPRSEESPEDTAESDASDGELLASLVRQGESLREARARAGQLLDLAGGPWGLPHLGRTQLESAGLSPESIARLRAACSLGARVAAARAPVVSMNAESTAAMFRPLLVHLPHEEMHVLLLDARGRYRSRRRVASGGVAACSVYVKDILAPAVELRAAAMVIIHNHPSGSCVPSAEDVALTSRVISPAETLGVRLVDHLVVAEEGYASAMPGPPAWDSLVRPRSRGIR